jgi:predicted phosphodiesterase
MPRKPDNRRFLKWCVISDLHGPYLNEEAFSLFLQAFDGMDYDQLVILGDLIDGQRISSHSQRFEIMNPVKPKSMDFHEEVDYTIKHILKPLRKAQPKIPILFIPGNHERRVIRALKGGGMAMEQLYEASARTRRSVHLDDLLQLDDFKIDMEYGEDNFGVYYLRHKGAKVAMLHGYKTNVGRQKAYLDYFQCNVLSGHTHRDGYLPRQTANGEIVACETMCLRTIKGIEYMDEGHDPGWKNGFVTIWIDKDTGQTWIKQQKIERGRLHFDGKVFSA